MNRRVSERTLMYHNALIVALRTSREPLTANDLVQRLPWVEQITPHPSYLSNRCTGLPAQHSDCGRVMDCNGSSHVVERRPGPSQVYSYLTALECDGLVQRAAGSVYGRMILWELTDHGAARSDINELRRITELDASTDDPSRRRAPAAEPAATDTPGSAQLNELIAAAIAAEAAAEKHLKTVREQRMRLEALTRRSA